MEFSKIDWSTLNYWGIVINVFMFLFSMWVVYIAIAFRVKRITCIKAIKYLISCMYVSIITPLVLIGLAIIQNNVDTGNILCIMLILGYIKYFYNEIVECISKVVSISKEEIKKKRGNKN